MRHDVSIKLAERPLPETSPNRARELPGVRPASTSAYGAFGIAVRDLDDAMAARNRVPAEIRGVMISYVDPAGPGRLARLRTGQVVLEINRVPVVSAAAFRALTSSLPPGEAAAVLVYDPLVDGRVIAAVIPDPGP